LICSCWNVIGTSTTSGSTVSRSERTYTSRENNNSGDIFQVAPRIAAWVVGNSTRITFGRTTFLTDLTEDGRPLRLLAVIDETTRECLTIQVERSFAA